ncbi:MAG: putative multidrug export ATP-binding/permease protein [Tenericutes bacterium ADurb.BinA155]|nr:MAG: putative multidrug export ATP-binding/permease protein [Tenericutes bacterium ADurb.BinA155]
MKALTPLKKYKAKVLLAPLFKLFECVCELFVPFLVKDIIDIGIAQSDGTYILTRSLIMLALAFAGFGVTMITQYLGARVSADYAYDLKKELYRQLNAISSRQLESFGKSKALTLINNDSFSLQVGVNMFMRLLVRAPFLVIGSVISAFILSPLAGCIVLGALLLSSAVIFIVMALTPKKYQAIQEELDHISTLGEDDLTGARVVRAFNKEAVEQTHFEKASLSYRKKAFVLARINAFINPLTFAFTNLGVFLVLYLAGYQSGSGVSVGTAVALMNYLAQALTALVLFSRLITSLSKALASKKRVDAFFAIAPDIVDGKENSAPIEVGSPLYSFQNVSLSFGGEEYALKNLNFEIKAGERIGLIGGTGSGKSSLVALLERFYDASQGAILFQGQDIKNYNLNSLRGNIALVSQKPQLYKGTIKSNLLLGDPSASEEMVRNALSDSLAEEFVSKFEDGLNHPVEEGGVNLSGGQKQRLLIARALLSNRPILILDDSTSALDYKSDLLVRQNIKKRHDLTTLIVSQRATSIRDCDIIYVLDHGEIAAKGTHEELLEHCAIYREIYETQVAVK